MTLVLCFCAVIALAIFGVVALQVNRDRRLHRLADLVIAQGAGHAAELQAMNRASVQALIGDRDRLLSAALARQEPLAAQALAMMDRETNRATGAERIEQLYRNAQQEGPRDPELVHEGQPIVPVGMGSYGD